MIDLVDVGLDHPRGGPPLLTDANVAVARGDVVVVVGAAGVGTSRLVGAALGEVPLAAGRIEVFGRDVAKLRRSSLRLLRRRIGIVPQELCLVEDRSAQLNVALPLEIDGIPRSVSIARAGEVLAALELESEASLPVDCLPASARQRVAVARALVRQPELILADQPTSAQDPHGADVVCAALAAAAGNGAAVVVFARDPQLCAYAARHGWRPYALRDGALAPLGALDARAIDELLAGVDALPATVALPDPDLPNVVPFPISVAGAR